MGYESKLIVVLKSKLNLSESELKWAEKVAEINLCKMDYNGPFHKALDKMRETNYYIYADDGNTEILEDRYGDKLKEINIEPLIKILEKEDQEYRRIKPALNLLKSFDKDIWPNIMVLHFGY